MKRHRLNTELFQLKILKLLILVPTREMTVKRIILRYENTTLRKFRFGGIYKLVREMFHVVRVIDIKRISVDRTYSDDFIKSFFGKT